MSKAFDLLPKALTTKAAAQRSQYYVTMFIVEQVEQSWEILDFWLMYLQYYHHDQLVQYTTDYLFKKCI